MILQSVCTLTPGPVDNTYTVHDFNHMDWFPQELVGLYGTSGGMFVPHEWKLDEHLQPDASDDPDLRVAMGKSSQQICYIFGSPI